MDRSYDAAREANEQYRTEARDFRNREIAILKKGIAYSHYGIASSLLTIALGVAFVAARAIPKANGWVLAAVCSFYALVHGYKLLVYKRELGDHLAQQRALSR